MPHFSDVFESVASPALGGCELHGGKGEKQWVSQGTAMCWHLFSDVLWAEWGGAAAGDLGKLQGRLALDRKRGLL